MGRKATIIKHLKMMGYLVGEDSGVCSVGLQNGSGRIFITFVSDEDLMYKDFIIEQIVGQINDLIIRDF